MAAAFTPCSRAGRPRALPRDGRRRRGAAAAALYSRVLFGGALAYWLFNTLGSVIRGTGNMALPASVMVGSGVPLPRPLARPDPRLGPAARASASRARPRRASPRSPRQPGAARIPALRRGAWCGRRSARPAPAVAALLGDPPRGRPGLAEHHPHEPDRGAPHRAGRALRRDRAGRLRPRRAARVSADPASCSGWARGSSPWSAPAWARATGRGPSAWRGSAPRWRPASPARSGSRPRCSRTSGSASSRPIPRSWPPAHATCASSGPPTASSAPASRSTSPRRARAACCGRSSPRLSALAIAAAGGWLATRWLERRLPGLFAAMAGALVAMGIINVAAVRFGAWRPAAGRRGEACMTAQQIFGLQVLLSFVLFTLVARWYVSPRLAAPAGGPRAPAPARAPRHAPHGARVPGADRGRRHAPGGLRGRRRLRRSPGRPARPGRARGAARPRRAWRCR